MTKKKAIYMIDGEPAKLRDVRASVQEDALGDYMTAKDVRNNVGIKVATLRSWRNSGKIRAKKIGGAWFYSRQALLDLIKASGG